MNIKDGKGRRGDGWKRNRFACFPRCCAKGGLPLTTWAPEHLHTDEQWQSRIRKSGGTGSREGEGRRGESTLKQKYWGLKGKTENRLRSAVQLWCIGSVLHELHYTVTLTDFASKCCSTVVNAFLYSESQNSAYLKNWLSSINALEAVVICIMLHRIKRCLCYFASHRHNKGHHFLETLNLRLLNWRSMPKTHTHLDGSILRGCDHDREDGVEYDTCDWSTVPAQGVSLRRTGDPLFGVPFLAHRASMCHFLFRFIQLWLQLHDLKHSGKSKTRRDQDFDQQIKKIHTFLYICWSLIISSNFFCKQI